MSSAVAFPQGLQWGCVLGYGFGLRGGVTLRGAAEGCKERKLEVF
ncbi:hypothetical protein [Synechococcus sp. CC9311]|nr:hypothetical protein [Synechococcus sp. CC9311]